MISGLINSKHQSSVDPAAVILFEQLSGKGQIKICEQMIIFVFICQTSVDLFNSYSLIHRLLYLVRFCFDVCTLVLMPIILPVVQVFMK